MDFDRHRDQNHGLKGNEKKFFHFYDFISFAFWSSRRLLRRFSELVNLKIVTDVLKVIPGISYALLIFDFFFDLVSHSLLSQRSLHTRAFKIAMVLITTPIAALSFVFSAALMNTIGACMNLVSNAWDSGTVIFSRLFGKLKNNDDPEENRAANLKLAESGHNMAINAFFILGGALMLNPVTAVAGTVVLIAITAYAIIDRLKINPLRWIGNQIFDYPFKKGSANTSSKKNSTSYVNDKIISASVTTQIVADNVTKSMELTSKTQHSNDSIFRQKSSVKDLITKFEGIQEKDSSKIRPI